MAVNYFEQFLAKRGLDEEILADLFDNTKPVLYGTDDLCKLLHDTPRDISIGCLSDYDTDGVISDVIKYVGLHLAGFTNMHISKRYVEKGYSFTKEDIDAVGDIKLLITSDVGIACFDAIDYAKSKGITVVVTDHHKIANDSITKNHADIIIDYSVEMDPTCNFGSTGELYPMVDVCGAYTIYQVFERYFELYGSEYANIKEIQSDLVKLRHLAAIATVSDSMPLIKINHCIVSEMLHFYNYINPVNGNDVIVKSVCDDPILQNVYNNMHIFIRECADAYYTGFDMKFLEYGVIPVINTIKRMCDDVSTIYNMFFGTEAQAQEAATYLVELNTKRKVMVNDIFQRMYVEHIGQPYQDIIYMTEAPSGILGLLAAKVMNETETPVVVLSKDPRFDDETCDYVYDGSIRSPFWYPFFSRVMTSKLAKCAGHEQACAITVPARNLPALYDFLRTDMQKYADFKDRPVTRSKIYDDFDIKLDYDANYLDFLMDVDSLMYNLKQLAPFGNGFPEPTMVLSFNKQFGAFSMLKENKHVKISLSRYFDVLLWNTALDDVMQSSFDDKLYVKGYLTESYFNGDRIINFIATPVYDGSELE